MAENIQRSRGRDSNYKFDAGGMPTEFGPFVGEIMNNVDPTRSGRVQVYIEQFGAGDKTNNKLWRTVSYVSPFAGATPKTSTSSGSGSFGNTNNQMSYGQSANPPDIGVKVICFFVGGDPSQGYYLGCIQEQGMNHMTPTIGASDKFVTQNANQETYFATSKKLPVVEINNAPENTDTVQNPKFFDKEKPVHSYLAASMFQQGLNNDPIRGSITSSSQRESPSNAYGQSTPGRPIYQGGFDDATYKQKLESGNVKETDIQVIGRRGGHSVVMDDGDVGGKNSLIRLRTAKGHQVTMSDDGNCFYIAHANGQVWLEFGQEGTFDLYTTNSVNIRTQGTINMHADKDINMFAGGNLNIKSTTATTFQSEGTTSIANKGALTLFSEAKIGIKANGQLAIQSKTGSWASTSLLSLNSNGIDLNGGPSYPVDTPPGLTQYTMPDSTFNASSGWSVNSTGLKSIVTRAPAHEPWPYHNQGVQVNVNLSAGGGATSPPPGAPTVPAGVTITKTGGT